MTYAGQFGAAGLVLDGVLACLTSQVLKNPYHHLPCLCGGKSMGPCWYTAYSEYIVGIYISTVSRLRVHMKGPWL